MRYQFMKTISADNNKGEREEFKEGQQIDEKDILAGCLESCKRLKTVVEIKEPTRPETKAK